MCGLAGFLGDFKAVRSGSSERVLNEMTSAIEHRGPDTSGLWLQPEFGLGLGHRRLAIVDLTEAGHQPMTSPSGRYVFAFNGEIYNHLDLRKELEKSESSQNWRGHSDTETMLFGFDMWGVQNTVEKCAGMFAFAVWDSHENILILGRDRLGEKPLYYGWQTRGDQRVFIFSSELAAVKTHSAFNKEIDRSALCLFLRHGYVPAPYSIYQGISKLRPGHLMAVSLAGSAEKTWKYWDAKSVIENGLATPFSGSATAAVDSLELILKNSVAEQMIADVPLGAFLSGGVDSSAIVALMQNIAKEEGGRPVKTFTIGFEEPGYNEAHYAKAVASHLGTDHTELYLSAQQALNVIPKLPVLYSEPFADSSQIPTFLVSHMARQHVTVSLSGDGGDELFGGYGRYPFAKKVWSSVGRVPRGARKFVAQKISNVDSSTWNRFLKPIQGILPNQLASANIGDKLHKGARILGAADTLDLYRTLISGWENPAGIVINGVEPPSAITTPHEVAAVDDFFHQMMAVDLVSYLPDDILCKVDRAAMGVSLETRVPLLDYRVVEFAWTLPLEYKVRDGVAKWPLRELLYKYVPRDLIDRKKMGFGIPLGEWLRGPLKSWAEELLDESRLKREGFFSPAPIRERWVEHINGTRNWAPQLWSILMFQAWFAEQ
ncbi:asparagine synthase (glutamine-hydrolyzing) [Variovorax paradoxus]|uniref:asparagine synthase (glutamine-hydrolyzing) n=1 Tax=Variovorax paradoxus TaxID=34073 RepID=UPI001ABD425C